ncbi:hypothetical protein CBW46_007615 [Paenibacillus xerothermodurans]|uniref:Uncharacterized protein n=1 Tax=Paenibacillus xerothermodurans TaxID=1977292 RepID=A0A2W1P0G0_PAEXE|nr:hypothetical protein CBW46_007615 [Paenibacillus xerothermodurans]
MLQPLRAHRLSSPKFLSFQRRSLMMPLMQVMDWIRSHLHIPMLNTHEGSTAGACMSWERHDNG